MNYKKIFKSILPLNTMFSKLLLFVVALLTVTISLVSITLYNSFSESAISQINEISKKTLIQQQISIEFILNQATNICAQLAFDSDVIQLVNSPDVDGVVQNRVLKRIKDLASINKSLYSISIYNGISDTYFSTDYPNTEEKAIHMLYLTNENMKFKAVPRKLEAGANGDKEKYVFSVFYYVKDKDTGKVLNAIIVNIKDETIRSLAFQEGDSKSENILIFNNQGIIMSSWNQKDLLQNFSDKKLIKDIFNSKFINSNDCLGFVENNLDGQKAIVSYSFSNKLDWHFTYIIPYNKATLNIYNLRNTIIIFCTIILILGIFFSVIISGRISSPFTKLIKSIKGIEGIKDNDKSEKLNETEFLSNYYSKLITKVNSLERFKESSKERLKCEYLIEFLEGSELPQKSDVVDADLNISFDQGVVVTIMRIDDMKNIDLLKVSSDHEDTRKKLIKTVFHIADSILKEHYLFECVQINSDGVIIINMDEQSCASNSFIELLTMVRDQVKELLGISITIAISTYGESLMKLSQCYNNAMATIDYKFVHGKGSILFYENVFSNLRIDYDYPYNKEKSLLEAIKLGREEQSMIIIEDIFESLKGFYYDFIMLSINHIWFSVFVTIELMFTYDTKGISESFDKMLQKIRKYETMDEVQKYAMYYMTSSIQRIKEGKKSNNKVLGEEIEIFLKDKFCSSELSIEMVAEKFNYNPIYFGKLFKELFSDSFGDYVVNLRINKSIEYILENKLSVKDISCKVGFNNPSYFMRWFKKNTGFSPSEYRVKMK